MFAGQDDKGLLQDEVRDTSRTEAQRIFFSTKSGTPSGLKRELKLDYSTGQGIP
ncbi:hypothetical protein P3TCK_25375 [Photobacterium profundum 3TCK]|uniref:Uncharacterized protein n=1 Tax=Photobacterium profundum 3TCK TaxID=314280 RepID=Q1Z090_9GAMM|nr:hypothetical protein P3TCK_25375 [Photobacterium profundum 3TCK]